MSDNPEILAPAASPANRRAGLLAMLVAGGRALWRYPGLALSLFMVQLMVAGLAGWVAVQLLADVFAHQTVLDEAVDGDLPALLFVLIDEIDVIIHILWAAIAAIIAYAMVSWFLVGGVNAVYDARPQGRRTVAQCFGAGGAQTFFAYLRLALLTIVPYVVVVILLAVGIALVDETLRYGLTVGELAAALAPALAPGLASLWLTFTAVDYARIALTRDPHLASWRALVRGYGVLVRSPWPLFHVLLYYAVFWLITALYVAGMAGAAMTGAGGALALFGVRTLVGAARFAAKLALVGGQIEHRR